jgi:hypothetical protein
MNLWQVADELARRLIAIFQFGDRQVRPVNGGASKFNTDPHWRHLVQFYEYFHGDNGAGIGASHQTGWTGLVAWLIKSRIVLDAADVLQKGHDAIAMRLTRSYY